MACWAQLIGESTPLAAGGDLAQKAQATESSENCTESSLTLQEALTGYGVPRAAGGALSQVPQQTAGADECDMFASPVRMQPCMSWEDDTSDSLLAGNSNQALGQAAPLRTNAQGLHAVPSLLLWEMPFQMLAFFHKSLASIIYGKRDGSQLGDAQLDPPHGQLLGWSRSSAHPDHWVGSSVLPNGIAELEYCETISNLSESVVGFDETLSDSDCSTCCSQVEVPETPAFEIRWQEFPAADERRGQWQLIVAHVIGGGEEEELRFMLPTSQNEFDHVSSDGNAFVTDGLPEAATAVTPMQVRREGLGDAAASCTSAENSDQVVQLPRTRFWRV